VSFLALLIAILVLQLRASLAPLHRDGWFVLLQARVVSWPPVLQLVLLVVVPAAVLALLHQALRPLGWGLPALALSVLVLIYAFGRGEFEALTRRYRAYCVAEDFEGAFLYIEAELGFVDEVDVPQDPNALHAWVQRRLAYSGFERWFAPVFYFLLLGPAGALAYRLLQLAARTDRDGVVVGSAERVLHALDWLPLRILGFSCALTGDFVASRDALRASLLDLTQRGDAVLHTISRAALGLASASISSFNDRAAFAQMAEWETQQLERLLTRSAVAWLVATALVIIAS
jgi:AmpE protein